MTVSPLLPTRQGPACLADGLRALHTMIDDLQALQVRPGDAVGLGEVDRARSRLDALRLRLIAAGDAGGVAEQEGFASTADWVAGRTRAGRQDSARATSLAGSLAGSGEGAPLRGTRAALDEGALSAEHARVIADALHRLPAGVTDDERARCEARLVADAARLDPGQLRRRARRVLAEIEPDPAVVDDHEDAQLVEEEDAAYARTSLTWHDDGDGTTTGRFTIPTLQADVLRKVLEAMTAPRRTGHEERRSLRDPAHARGLAFVQLLEHLPTDHLHGPATTQVTVLLDHDTLLGRLRAAGLDTDRPISGGEARRLACSSRITPVVLRAVLGGRSRVLDLGRGSRLFTEAHRTAVHATHTHCAARGCSRPIAWCELHHRTPWSEGGRTDLREAVPLCGFHHRAIHHRDHVHTWHPDGTLTTRRRT